VSQAAVLSAMAVLDAALVGFRAVVGRDAHLDPRALITRWMIRGALAGVAALIVAGLLLGTLLATADDPGARYEDLVTAGTRMLLVYVPYTVIVLVALAGYAVPVLDLRCLATTIVLGPLTLARPAVMALGAGAAAWHAPVTVQIAAFATVGILLAVEASVHRSARRIPPAGVEPKPNGRSPRERDGPGLTCGSVVGAEGLEPPTSAL
jgi:hypothetical protein